jgi:hypothetical protein
MTRAKRFAAAGLLLWACALAAVTAAQPPPPDGPWIGTWRRNAARSTPPTAGDAVFTMWVEGDGFRYTYESVAPDGARTRMEAFGRFDGRPYPETGNPMADHNVFTRVDDRTYALIDLKDGKETIRFTITISPDGQTRTSVSRRRNDRGEEVTTTGVWDRVK